MEWFFFLCSFTIKKNHIIEFVQLFDLFPVFLETKKIIHTKKKCWALFLKRGCYYIDNFFLFVLLLQFMCGFSLQILLTKLKLTKNYEIIHDICTLLGSRTQKLTFIFMSLNHFISMPLRTKIWMAFFFLNKRRLVLTTNFTLYFRSSGVTTLICLMPCRYNFFVFISNCCCCCSFVRSIFLF